MSNLISIQAEIAKLMHEAEAIRSAKFDEMVGEIKAKMTAYEITLEDLDAETARRTKNKSRRSVNAEKALVEQVLIKRLGATPAPVAIQIAEYLNRKNLRPYEQGVMYQRALDEGLFSSNRKIAQALGVDIGGVGKLLAIARLPGEVLKAFNSPLDIQYEWGAKIQAAIECDQDAVIDEAKTIQSEPLKPTAKEVLARLIAAAAGSAISGDVTPAPVVASGVTPDEISDAAADASDEAARRAKKARKAAKDKTYQLRNREKIAASGKAFRAANPDYDKTYRKENPEKIATHHKTYYLKNREEIAAKKKARYEANKLEKLATAKPETPTTITEVVEPTKNEYRRMTPEEVSAFVRSLYRGPSDLQRSLAQQTPKQLEKADKAWRKKMGR